MNAQRLFTFLRHRDATLVRKGDKLVFQGQPAVMTDRLRSVIKANRDTLLVHIDACARMAGDLIDQAARLYPLAGPSLQSLLVEYQHAFAACRDRGELDVLELSADVIARRAREIRRQAA